MSFDFTSVIDRAGNDALAFDAVLAAGDGPRGNAPEPPSEGFDLIPMWVADMNFATAPAVTNAIAKRLAHPLFGYFAPTAEFFDAVSSWHAARNGVEGIAPEHIGYDNGVLGGLVATLEAFTAPGDSVLVHSPTYIGFTGSIENAGRRIVLSPLVRDEAGVWRMDYADMERKLAENRIHFAVFCSPHNPTGRVWERWEIERAMEVYANANCVVVSDEIWSDLVLPGHTHIPTQSVSDDARRRTVALYAPSKTFNLAGLVGSYHLVYDPYVRDRVEAQASKCHYNAMNVLWMHALVGAYSSEGAAWLDELREVIARNVERAYRFFTSEVSGIECAKPEGTYMLFIDCERWCAEHGRTLDELLRAGWKVGVGWQDGRPFHGEHSIRLNLALPAARLEEALGRLAAHVL